MSVDTGCRREGTVKNIQSVDDTGNPAQDGQTDVDQEISTATALQEDTQRGQDDRKDDLADIAIIRKLAVWPEALDRSLSNQEVGGENTHEAVKGMVMRYVFCADESKIDCW